MPIKWCSRCGDHQVPIWENVCPDCKAAPQINDDALYRCEHELLRVREVRDSFREQMKAKDAQISVLVEACRTIQKLEPRMNLATDTEWFSAPIVDSIIQKALADPPASSLAERGREAEARGMDRSEQIIQTWAEKFYAEQYESRVAVLRAAKKIRAAAAAHRSKSDE